jgi:hypothetical protein
MTIQASAVPVVAGDMLAGLDEGEVKRQFSIAIDQAVSQGRVDPIGNASGSKRVYRP